MLQHVGNDVGQVFLRDELLLVAQLDDALGDLAHRLIVELQSQIFQVLADVGLARVLAQGILAAATEAFGQQIVVIEVALVVAVGMYACHLREDVFADDRFIGGDGDAGVRLHHAAHLVQTALVDTRHGVEVVFQDGLHAGQRGVAGTFAQAVDGGVQSSATAQHSGQHVGHGQVIVVMGMEIEMSIRITLLHLAHKLNDLQGVEYAQRIGQHEAADTCISKGVHQLENVFG